MSLRGKHALITGSSRGIGRGIALKLAEKGVKVAAFGRENELGAFQTSLADVDSDPLVLGGKTYLMTVGHGAIGWRVSPESGLILYTLKDGKLEPAGAAIVGQSRGALESVRTAEWKIRGLARCLATERMRL
jgi:short chain dehydrogenase